MSRLRDDPSTATVAWLDVIVAVVAIGTLLFPGDALALAFTIAVAFFLFAGWYVHMRVIKPAFRIEVCLRPFGRLRF